MYSKFSDYTKLTFSPIELGPSLIDELVLLPEGPDSDESTEGVGEVGEDGRAADALEALEFPGGRYESSQES